MGVKLGKGKVAGINACANDAGVIGFPWRSTNLNSGTFLPRS